MSKEKCFIIMPLTTHPDWVPHYEGDAEHFRHVLEDLFCPAIQNAGLEPVLPIADGADIIHAKIIQEIELSAVVLCDMSRLNPNVFFELGIRTAVGKPMCLVVDEKTRKQVPFDVGVVNYHEYQSSMAAYIVKKEMPRLTEHIRKSVEGSKGKNTLWERFGLSARASLPTEGDPLQAKVDVFASQILAKVDGLASQVDAMNRGLFPPAKAVTVPSTLPTPPPAPSAGPVIPLSDGTAIRLTVLWQLLLDGVGHASAFTRSYLADAIPISLDNGVLTIGFDEEYVDQMDLVNNTKTNTLLQSKLAELGFPNHKIKFVKVVPQVVRGMNKSEKPSA